MSAVQRRATRRELAAGLAACLGLGLLLRAPAANIPLERDEGEYAYVARGWLDGRLPYATAFDQKPPAAFAAYAAVLEIFGGSPAAVHWSAELWTLAGLVLLFASGAALGAPLAGLLAAALGAWLTTAPCLRANAANTELLMLPPLAGALWCALEALEGASVPLALAAGLLSGLAVLFKQVALANAAALAAALALDPRRRGARLGAFALGLAALPLLTAGYFAAHGAWTSFFDCVVRYNLGSYARQVPLARYPVQLAAALIPLAKECWGVLALAGVGLAAGFPAAPRARRAFALWAAASALGVAAGGWFREHYFLQLVPALALLGGRGAESLAARLGRGRGAAAALTAAAIAAGVVAAPGYYLGGTSTQKSRLLYGLNPFPESPELARFVASRTAPDDAVFVLGSEPQLLFEAGRRSATRYVFAYPLMAPGAEGLVRQREALADFDRARPKLVVVEYSSGSFLPGPDSPRLIFDEVARRAAASYRVVGFLAADFARGENRLILGEDAVAAWDKARGPGSGAPALVLWQRRDDAPVE